MNLVKQDSHLRVFVLNLQNIESKSTKVTSPQNDPLRVRVPKWLLLKMTQYNTQVLCVFTE